MLACVDEATCVEVEDTGDVEIKFSVFVTTVDDVDDACGGIPDSESLDCCCNMSD